MTDEERYGKVGAEIRRLDPEAYKNRPKTMEGNIKLLNELRAKSKETPARQLSTEEFMSGKYRRADSEAPSMVTSKGPSTRGGRRASAEETEESNKRIRAAKATQAMERNRGTLPSDRASGFRSQAQETGMTAEERAEKARDYSKNVAMTAGAGRLAGAAAKAQPFLRAKQMFRRFKTNRANEAERAADVAGEASRRGMSRRDVPSFSERYKAGEAAAARRAQSPKGKREEIERMLDEKLAADMAGGFRKGGRVKKYAGGGSVSSRADGIAKRGKTRCRII